MVVCAYASFSLPRDFTCAAAASTNYGVCRTAAAVKSTTAVCCPQKACTDCMQSTDCNADCRGAKPSLSLKVEDQSSRTCCRLMEGAGFSNDVTFMCGKNVPHVLVQVSTNTLNHIWFCIQGRSNNLGRGFSIISWYRGGLWAVPNCPS